MIQRDTEERITLVIEQPSATQFEIGALSPDADECNDLGRGSTSADRVTALNGRFATGTPLCILQGLTYYFFTTLIVILGVCFGMDFVSLCHDFPKAERMEFIRSFSVWDGGWYSVIVRDGYSYNPDRQSSVAFFPVYPMLAQIVAKVGFDAETALLIVSQMALACAFGMAAIYVKSRLPDNSNWSREYVLLAMGILPSTFYLRMAYTESLFLFFVIVTLYGIQKNWASWWIAIVVGAATGTRSVGVALFAPLAIHLWQTSGNWRTAVFRGVTIFPLACWGLLAFIVFQWWAFNEPLAFVHSQAHWSSSGSGAPSFPEKIIAFLTFAPIRAVYDKDCPCYWALVAPKNDLLFNLRFLEPIAFVGFVAVICWGAMSRWLTTAEWVLGALLMLIPYFMQADRMCMFGQIRFSSVVFPVYLVIGQFLARMRSPAAVVFCSFCGVFLAVYSAMFVSWYSYY